MRVKYNILIIIIALAGCIQSENQIHNIPKADSEMEVSIVEFMKTAKQLELPVKCYSSDYYIYIDPDKVLINMSNQNILIYQNSSLGLSYMHNQNQDCWQMIKYEIFSYEYIPPDIIYCEISKYVDINISKVCFNTLV
ncbi:MAG: hypothetical protein QXE47_02765 [Candidatus Anstonellales archaeon]